MKAHPNTMNEKVEQIFKDAMRKERAALASGVADGYATIDRKRCTFEEISFRVFAEISPGHGEAKRLRYLEAEPGEVEKASLLFDWIDENYSLADYLKRDSHWRVLQKKLTLSKDGHPIFSPESLEAIPKPGFWHC
jgi:hypothetical protein